MSFRSFVACLTYVLLFSLCGMASEFPPQVEEEANKDAAEFILKEVLPAFGGLNAIEFRSYPKISGSFDFVNKRVILDECSAKLNLNQVKPIRYNIIEIPVYLDAKSEVGGKRSFRLDLSCEKANPLKGEVIVKAHLYFVDEEGNKVPYQIKVYALDQEQITLNYYGSNVRFTMHHEEQSILYNGGEYIPFRPEYSNYIMPNGNYQLPLPVWLGDDKLIQVNPILADVDLNAFFNYMLASGNSANLDLLGPIGQENEESIPQPMQQVVQTEKFDIVKSMLLKTDHVFSMKISINGKREETVFHGFADYYNFQNEQAENFQTLDFATMDEKRK